MKTEFRILKEGKDNVKDNEIGLNLVDAGIVSFATLSNGEKVENPRFFKIDQNVLAKAQRKLEKQTKDNPERQKIKKVVSRIHERISNKRYNFCLQEARRIVDKFGLIGIED